MFHLHSINNKTINPTIDQNIYIESKPPCKDEDNFEIVAVIFSIIS